MIRLNLLPDLKKDFLRAQRMRARTITIAILITIVSVGALVALGLYVYGAQTVIIAVQTSNISQKYNKLQDTKDLDKYLTVQNQLSSIAALHDDKYDMARIVDFATKVNIPDKPATYTNLTVDMDNEVTASAAINDEVGTMVIRGFISDFAAFKRLQDSFANATVDYTLGENDSNDKKKGVTVFALTGPPEIALQPDNHNLVNFTINLTILKEPFKWKAKNAVITVPNLDTTDSSQNTPNPFGGTQ